MVWLLDGEKNLKICLVASTEYTKVTDRQTDRRTGLVLIYRTMTSYGFLCSTHHYLR